MQRGKQGLRGLLNLPSPSEVAKWSPFKRCRESYKWLMWLPQQVVIKVSSSTSTAYPLVPLLWPTRGSTVARMGADWDLPQREGLVNSAMLCAFHCFGFIHSCVLWRSQMDLISLVSYRQTYDLCSLVSFIMSLWDAETSTLHFNK